MATKSEGQEEGVVLTEHVTILNPNLAGKLEKDTELEIYDCVINVEAKTSKGDG